MESLTPKLILVPTDFSPPAAHALRYASALAERFDAHLLVMYADAFVPPIDFTGAAAGQFALSRGQMIDETSEELIRFAEQNISPKVPYDTRVVVDSPVRGIIDQAAEAGCDLIVMGTHGRTGVRRLVIGSVTETIIRTSSIPVIAVNALAPESATVARVLCPVSYTNSCRDALIHAAALTNSLQTPLILLRAIEIGDAKGTAEELQRLQEWVPTELAGRCEMKIVSAQTTADQILAMANATAADLIALGAEHSHGMSDAMRGTTADRVIQHSGCPVLAVSGAAVQIPSAALVNESE